MIYLRIIGFTLLVTIFTAITGIILWLGYESYIGANPFQ